MNLKDLQGIKKDEIQKVDHQRYYVTDADGFSPERNKAIVEETIAEYEKTREKKINEKVEHYAERADAVITYLRALDRGGSESNITRYFGKQMLAYLRGQQIRDKLMSGLTLKDKQGGIIKRGI